MLISSFLKFCAKLQQNFDIRKKKEFLFLLSLKNFELPRLQREALRSLQLVLLAA